MKREREKGVNDMMSPKSAASDEGMEMKGRMKREGRMKKGKGEWRNERRWNE